MEVEEKKSLKCLTEIITPIEKAFKIQAMFS